MSTSPSLFAAEATPLPRVPYDLPADLERWNGIALVGEAPGREEARLGHPFVGRSGQLLNENLQKAGISRKDSLVANVFRSQPPGNKVDHFFASRRAAKESGRSLAENLGPFGSAWCLDEFAADILELQETLKRLAPRVVVALGRTPLWALTGQNGLLTKVGQKLENRLVPGLPVIPTYHPSFILRGNWGLQDQWVEHLTFAATQ